MQVQKTKKMLTFPNAKINLGLNVIEKRPDGFHNLETVFYPLGLCDTLEFVVAPAMDFQNSGIAIDGRPEDNLVLKAYSLLQNDFDIPSLGIHLHKKIPFGAGLGGGSSDAAYMLKMLSDEFNLALSLDQLQDYARQLGSDCAFFVENKPVFATGKGDKFAEVELSMSGYQLLLIKPNVHVPTKDAYGKISPKKPTVSLKEIIRQPIESWKGVMENDFEVSVFEKYPEIADIKRVLYEAGACYASMSGSGSSVFGIFKDEVPEVSFPTAYFVWQETL